MMMFVRKRLFNVFICIVALVSMATCSFVNKHQYHPKGTPIKARSMIRARVIIDAGHGGEDSGAVGARGLKEKDITLDVASRLGRLFKNLMPNVDVVMTRSSDTYVGLEKRVQMANQRKGDAFISLHINSSESKKSSGFETYSLDVASDNHAKRLAARENLSSNGRNPADFIRADMRAFSNRADSDRLASWISRGIGLRMKDKGRNRVLDRGNNQAIFHVLFVRMPAVLLELFFISNPKEELMLSKKTEREKIAQGIFLGVREFLLDNHRRASHVSNR